MSRHTCTSLRHRGAKRIENHPVLGPAFHGPVVRFTCDGIEIESFSGETIAAALIAAGIHTFGETVGTGKPRGYYCGIGHCFECRVTLNGTTNQRSCLALVREGIDVRRQAAVPGHEEGRK